MPKLYGYATKDLHRNREGEVCMTSSPLGYLTPMTARTITSAVGPMPNRTGNREINRRLRQEARNAGKAAA